MTSKTKVSVIIPIYNAEKTLQKSVDSVLDQTYSDLELILVDDGSIDSSGVLCDRYSQKDNRVIVIHQKNSGVSRARNEGIKASTGEYIMFLDADDDIEKNLLEENVHIIEEKNPEVIIFCFRYVLPNRIVNNEIDQKGVFFDNDKEFFEKRLKHIVGKEMMNAPWNKIIRRDLIQKNKLCFDERFSILEDAIFSVSVCAAAKTICVNSGIYHNYYLWDTGSLRTKWSVNRFQAIKELYRIELAYCRKYSNNIKQVGCFSKTFCNSVFTYMQMISVNKKLSGREKKKLLKEVCGDNTVRQNLLKKENKKNFDLNRKTICLFVRMKMTIMIRLLYSLKNIIRH